jgi:hypothetical protein
MTDLGRRLREQDPIRVEGLMAPPDVRRVRALVLASTAARQSVSWTRFAVIAAGLVAAVSGGIWSVNRAPAESAARATTTADTPATAGEPVLRQVYFSTPGGTRVVWQFNSAFELR